MKAFSLQFHATRAEVEAFARVWTAQWDLVQFWELRSGRTNYVEMASASDAGELVKIGLKPRALLSSTTNSDGISFVSDVLAVHLGEESDESLRECLLYGVADNDDLFAFWKKIRKYLIRRMFKGAWAVGPAGVRVREAGHYYTSGAKAAAEAGRRMLALGGAVQYDLD